MAEALKRGNEFRDLVDRVLAAAGFRTSVESRVDFKKVDNIAIWTRDEIQGPARYAFEAKDFSGTLPKDECAEFASEYGILVRNRSADCAWLVSRGPISPDGKALIEAAGLRCSTFLEFQRRLLLLDGYLGDLVAEFDATKTSSFYIKPETSDGNDLEGLVRDWMDEENASPLFVLGGYGKGKSTFARHLAAKLAAESLRDATLRAPILVQLGEIVDEQSVEGLLGKVMASRYRVPNYHFETFRELNRLGRFVIIYDGFDEMKHGMTLPRFQIVLNELMKLDEGQARILVLGRDTAFHDDIEFKAIIDGRQVTRAGRHVPDLHRRPYRTTELRGFTQDESYRFVRSYFPIRANAIAEQRGARLTGEWLDSRINRLLDGAFDTLLERPVHAQMLCEIAAQPEFSLQKLTVYDLFDTFVHYLLDRETRKKGRDPQFDINVRRAFNGSLAWWLWERGGASTTTLNDVPQSICAEAAQNVQHDHDDIGLRRELIQGCLIEKAGNTIYFGHRSLQEFLVAEHLIETSLLEGAPDRPHPIERVLTSINREVTQFLVAGAQVNDDRRERVVSWFDRLTTYPGNDVSLQSFELFVGLARALTIKVPDPSISPWLVWLEFFLKSGNQDFSGRTTATFAALGDILAKVQSKSEQAQAAAAYALARVLRTEAPLQGNLVATAIAGMIPIRALQDAVSQVRGHRNARLNVLRGKSFLLWSFLRGTSVTVDGRVLVHINSQKLLDDAKGALHVGFADDASETPKLAIAPQLLYQALANLGASEKEIEGIRPYFAEAATRTSIYPLEVEVKERRHSVVTTKQ